jgi:urease subunit gamma/beta
MLRSLGRCSSREAEAVRITPHEQERLLIHVAADVARARRQRGLLLNHPESVAILTDWVLEGARDGRSVADLMQAERHVLSRADVMAGVPEMITEVQVEATFPDGTKLVTLHDPIVEREPRTASQVGERESAAAANSEAEPEASAVIPGEVVGPADHVELNVGRPVVTLRVENRGDRPVQVGWHYHFAEANPALAFDRRCA